MRKPEDKPRSAVIILAAGESKRLGHPKQFIILEELTLLERTVISSLGSDADVTVVVIGAYAGRSREILQRYPVTALYNYQWREGMASSIRCSVTHLLNLTRRIDSAVIMPCDQPGVNSTHINKLFESLHSSGKSICASAYGGVAGAPCAFQSSVFERLLALKGDRGAASLIRKSASEVATVDFSAGAYDIDIPSELRRHGFAADNSQC